MLAAVAVFVWLGALALFVATFVSNLVPLLLRADDWRLFAVTVPVILLVNRALAGASLRRKGALGPYEDRPRWALIVQIFLLALFPILALSLPPGRASGDRCSRTMNGEPIELSEADCQTLRVRAVRVLAEGWMAIDWVAVVQYALARRRKPDGNWPDRHAC